MYSLDGVEEGSEEKLILSGDEIELNIPEEGVVLPSGWAILPLTQLKVNTVYVYMVWATKKFPFFNLFIKTVFIHATETEWLGHGTIRSMVN